MNDEIRDWVKQKGVARTHANNIEWRILNDLNQVAVVMFVELMTFVRFVSFSCRRNAADCDSFIIWKEIAFALALVANDKQMHCLLVNLFVCKSV